MRRTGQKVKVTKLNSIKIEDKSSLIKRLKGDQKDSRHYMNAVEELLCRKLTFSKFPESSSDYKKIFSVLD